MESKHILVLCFLYNIGSTTKCIMDYEPHLKCTQFKLTCKTIEFAVVAVVLKCCLCFQPMIHRDHSANPGFYSIVKENFKKKDPTLDKDIDK